MNKMDGSSTYSQPLGRMHQARGITSTSTISKQHLNDLVDGSQVTRHLHSSVAGARQRKQVGIAGNLANLSPYKVLQISRLTKSCKSLTSQTSVNLWRCAQKLLSEMSDLDLLQLCDSRHFWI